MPRTTAHLVAASLLLGFAACSPAGTVDSIPEDPGLADEELRTCAGGEVQHGIDVSEHNGVVNWAKIKQSGKAFAFARVSDGVNFPDDQFAKNWAGMKSAGVLRGAYQYFRPGQSATTQADMMIAAIGSFSPGDLPPVIDVETANGQSGAKVISGLKTWIARVKDKTGRDPLIYAASGFWNTLPNTAQFAGSRLWVANYGATCPSMPSTWTQWSFWQYSESGKVPGVSGPVDLNVFNGSLQKLSALAGLSPVATCTSDAECNHGAPGAAVVCANSGANAGKCIDGCHVDSDCPAGGTCDESAPTWTCTTAPPVLGSACMVDEDCSGGQQGTGRVCGASSKTCILGCHDTASDCPSGTECNQAGAVWYCAPGSLPLGAPCTTDAQCGKPGDGKVCGASSQTCMVGCHDDTACPSGQVCDKTKNPWVCGSPVVPNACPVLTYPSGVKIQSVKNAAMTASYQNHLNPGQSAPTCFLDVSKLHDPVAMVTYNINVKVAAHFMLSELCGTEVDQGYGNFVLMRPEAVLALEKFRVSVGVPVSVNSGFRGPKHQEDVCESLCGDPLGCPGTCSNNSRHMWGDGFDLPLAFYSNAHQTKACAAGFKFTYLESGTHHHVDMNPAYATCVKQ